MVNLVFKPTKIFLSLILLCVLPPMAFAARTVYVAVTPTTSFAYTIGNVLSLYCDIWNPNPSLSTPSQVVTLSPIAVGASETVDQTTSTTVALPTKTCTLTQYNACNSFWQAIGGSAAAFPRGLTISVTPNAGALVGNCTVQIGGTVNMLQSIPINGGRPF